MNDKINDNLNEENVDINTEEKQENQESQESQNASNDKPTQGKLRETLNNFKTELQEKEAKVSEQEKKIAELQGKLLNQNNEKPDDKQDMINLDKIIEEKLRPVKAVLDKYNQTQQEQKLDQAVETLYRNGATEEMVKEALNSDSSLLNSPERLVGVVLSSPENAKKIASMQLSSSNVNSVSINSEQGIDQNTNTKSMTQAEFEVYDKDVVDALKDF